MDPYPLTLVLVFILSIILSGSLTGIKTVIGFLYRQGAVHSPSPENGKPPGLIGAATAIWQKPGFFESLGFGRFILDGAAIISGTQFLRLVFWDITLLTAGTWTILVTFMISHWLFPSVAQVFAESLGPSAIRFSKIYSFFLMGKIGEWLYKAHEITLKKMGYDSQLGFLGETRFQKLGSDDDENPDRNGLQEDEREMIRSIFDLRETQVREIMTPRVDMVGLEVETPYEEVIELITHEKFSRIPVYKETMDSIQGTLHVMDLMGIKDEDKKADFSLRDYLREAYFVPRTKKIGELLKEFRQKHIHMAIVVDEYGGTAGLITLEDILEEIVGEIHDEDETETMLIRKVDEGIYLIDPIVSLFDLKDELGIELKTDDENIQIDTLGGFILFLHGKVPEMGDVVRYKEYSFDIIEMDGQKMENIRMTINSLVNSQT